MEHLEPPVQSTPLSDLLLNVFSSPGDAFEGLKPSPARASVWIIPMIIIILIASGFSYVMFTNPTLKDQFMQAQEQALQKSVDSGKMTQAQADQSRQGMEKMGGMFIAFGIIGSVVFVSVMFFGAALVLWLAGKIAMGSTAGYGKYLEIYGLSGWIGILGGIITLLMVIAMGSLYASPSAALAVLSNYNPTDNTHKILSALNIFSIWQAAVIGIGMGKIAGKSTGLGMGIAFGLWVVWVAITVFLGFGR
ncbi:MAG: YIP1 family protein [Ignavibacteriales bacterium]|nr:YIP1 family protein [Ignavibacteriales bacterium]